MDLKTDYLVVGSGATGMAFVDTLLQESDADIIMIDKRHAPGGHWNDAYPFVRLHQPSMSYGVASRPLGRDRVDETGTNKGFYELASGAELNHYYHSLMQETFLPTGRVRFFPLCEHRGDGEFVSLVSGETYKVDVRKKLVNAAQFQTQIPSTHKRKFDVADGVTCIPPNDLPKHIADHDHVTVLGAGKTAMDAIVWLQELGYPIEAISWVVPRDMWMWNRKFTQPGMEFFEQTIGGQASAFEVYANAETPKDIAAGLEKAGIWMRLDQDIWPEIFHAPTVTEMEADMLRKVQNIIRLGRVTRIDADKMVLQKGEVTTEPNTLFVDCTASAGAKNVGDQTPVFREGEINLQMVRQIQPCFSAAIIAYIEAHFDSDEEKANLARPTPMFDTVEDYATVLANGMMNQFFWGQDPGISKWMSTCRLNGPANLIQHIAPDDEAKRAVVARLVENAPLAAGNLMKLAEASAKA